MHEQYGVVIRGYLSQIGPIEIPFKSLGDGQRTNAVLFGRCRELWGSCEVFMDELRKAGDSVGAKITTVAEHVPVGWGAPVYAKLDADLAGAMMSINAVKAVEIGSGFASVAQRGSEHGDELTPEGFVTNHAGGVLGGISTGQDVVVTIAIKPTSSIRVPRRSIDKAGNAVSVETNGRHDPCVGIRATPIAEAMMALVLMDHALLHRAQNADVRTSTPRIAASVQDINHVAHICRFGKDRFRSTGSLAATCPGFRLSTFSMQPSIEATRVCFLTFRWLFRKASTLPFSGPTGLESRPFSSC